MKKYSLFLLSILLTGLFVLPSCSDDDDTTPMDPNPAMNFFGGSGYVSGDITIPILTDFKVGITAASSTESGAKLTKFQVTRVFDNKPTIIIDSTINTSSFTYPEIYITSNGDAGTEKFYFTITDKNGKTKELSFTITTTDIASPGPINTWSMKILGAQQNATGSSFASIDGTIYTLPEAKLNSAKIDWLYFHGAVNLATLAAPDDPDAQSVYSTSNGPGSWAVKNPTRFKKIGTAVDWNAITDDEIILDLTSSGVDQTKINMLAKNDVLGFLAANGKRGLIKVEDITGEEDGTITISVKVQQ